MSTGYRKCDFCPVRILVVRGADGQKIPALNWGQDPAGSVAVTIDDPRRGRFLARGEQPGQLEHAYSVHECDGMKHAAQRQTWRQAAADLHRDQRNRRGRRPGPQITGVVVQPAPLPGMEQPPGRNQ